MSVFAGPTRRELYRLLKQYNEFPERRETIVAEIDERFRHPVAIMVIDSCSFSARVQAQGIVHFLALLERIERVILPHIEVNKGRLLREDADNFFAAFPDADSALRCASDVCRDIEIANGPLPAADEICISVGIGQGEVLVVGTDDLFGDEMNLACKLGEDLAGQNEILLTERARAGLTNSDWPLEPVEFNVSGLKLPAFRLLRDTTQSAG